jgi:hypothetical protein
MSSHQDSNNSDKAWRDIVALFRRLCFMRRMGKADEALQILSEVLPSLIVQWSNATGEPLKNKRLRLAHMFHDEQLRVADAYALHELSSMQWQQEMVPQLTRKIAQEIKNVVASQLEANAARQKELGQEIQALSGQLEQETSRRSAQEAVMNSIQKTVEDAVQNLAPAPIRIPFDDIPTIIDQINDEERRTHSSHRKNNIRSLPFNAQQRADSADKTAGSPRTIRVAVA